MTEYGSQYGLTPGFMWGAVVIFVIGVLGQIAFWIWCKKEGIEFHWGQRERFLYVLLPCVLVIGGVIALSEYRTTVPGYQPPACEAIENIQDGRDRRWARRTVAGSLCFVYRIQTAIIGQHIPGEN